MRPEPPIEIGREAAAQAARDELSRGIYADNEPGPLRQALSWVLRQVFEMLDTASGSMPGGVFGLVVLALMLIAAFVVIRWRLGALRRTAQHGDRGMVFAERRATAAEHNERARAAAASGDYDTGVLEGFRGVVRRLEERTVLDERPGRTADETAREIRARSAGGVGAVSEVSGVSGVSDVSGLHGNASAEQRAVGLVRSAAGVFDEVCYGGRPANAEAYQTVLAADEAAGTLRAVR